jgi:hypothetical protein
VTLLQTWEHLGTFGNIIFSKRVIAMRWDSSTD